jgi:hypothetical protein
MAVMMFAAAVPYSSAAILCLSVALTSCDTAAV